MTGENTAILIDCSQLSQSELNARLRTTESESSLKLSNVGSGHGLASGVCAEASIEVEGSVGDFAFMLGKLASIEVNGNAGDGCGHSFVSGRLLVRGSARDYLGAFAKDGFIIVHGNARDYCGYALSGGDVLVRSTVGNEAGCEMRDGVLVLGNGAGKHTGHRMSGGTLYVRGEVQSFSEDVKLLRMKDADSMRLSLLLARAGIKGNVKDFKAYRARTSEK